MTFLRRHAFALLFALCLVASLLPLWVGGHLPAVDVPQHLFLIHVLGQLADGSSPYSEIYVARPGLTYLTFYYSVRAMAAWVGVETALRLWLTLVLAGIPLSLLALLRAFGRSHWLALLAFPLIYTDSFYWGLVSFQSSLPLTLLTMAGFVVALEAPAATRRARWALAGTAVSLLLLQLTHAAGMIFPAAALPLLLLTTLSDWKRRGRALLALAPGVTVFLAWLLTGVDQGRQYGAPGEPWKAAAPLLAPENFVFTPLAERAAKLPELLANGFWSWADRPALHGLGLVALALAVLALIRPPPAPASWRGWLASSRPALLLGLALAYFFLLPTDITGYMYYIHPRYAQLAALLAIPVLIWPTGRPSRPLVVAAAAVAVYAGVNLTVLFHRFDVEARSFEQVARHLPRGARIMHLVLDWGSRWSTHAVYLHYPALAALRAEGVPSFSLALDPSFPVGYREGARPPAPPWEWQPQRFDWDRHATWYDHYLLRGDASLESLFGPHAAEVEEVARADRWRLLRRVERP